MVGSSLKETWAAFEAALAAGKARAIGTSDFSTHELSALIGLGGAVPAVNQSPMSAGDNLTEILTFCRAHGIKTEGSAP